MSDKLYYKLYYLRNREQMIIAAKERYWKNREHVLAQLKQYRKDNRDKISARRKEEYKQAAAERSCKRNLKAKRVRVSDHWRRNRLEIKVARALEIPIGQARALLTQSKLSMLKDDRKGHLAAVPELVER